MHAAEKAMKSWIERECALDGVLAGGGGLGATSGFSAFASGEMVLAGNDEAWRIIGGNLAHLADTGAPVEELLWGFEHAVLCTVQRADGVWLGVFTVPKLPDESALALREKLDDFKQQNFAS